MDSAVGGEGMPESEPWPVLARELEPVVMWTTDAELLRRERPDVGVLYMSGYADDQVIGRRELEADALLLEKPFTRELLGRKVREALAAGPGRRSAG